MSDLISFVPAATPTTSTGASAAASLSTNFDTFLTILTAQIQNQDPLEPMDSSQFTEQLVQFSGVEQQIRANTQLETLISTTRSSAGASLSGYLGEQAEISTAGAQFSGEPVNWRYTLPSDAAAATVTVTDVDGNVIYSKTGEPAAGVHDFTWNGQGFDGETVPGGAYYINVVAEDANGATVTAMHSLLANITGVDLTYGEPALTTSAGVFAYADILRLTRQ